VTDPARVKGYFLVTVVDGFVQSTAIGLTASVVRDNLNDVSAVVRWLAGR